MDHKVQAEKENQTDHKSKSLVWDCGSSLYDSFELKSFERQLHSAISSRTLSMPRLSDHRTQHAPPPPPPPQSISKKFSIFSRSFQKLLRSVFRPKHAKVGSQHRFFADYDRSGPLSTIPELPESGGDYGGGGGHSPDFESAVVIRRSVSDRFTATSIGISCA